MAVEKSEYGGHWRSNTLPAHDKGDQLSASEKLRLMYLTGQTEDPTVAPSTRSWQGFANSPDSIID